MRTRRKSTRVSSDPIPADILLTIEEMQISPDRVRGDEAWARCPGPHETVMGTEDRHASWSINLDTGEHHCFSCGWGGRFITLVQWMNDWDKHPDKAEEWIRKHGGIGVAKKKLQGLSGWQKKEADKVTEADMALFTDPPEWALRDKDVELDSCRAYGVLWDPEHDRWVFPIRDPFTGSLMGWQAKNKRVFLNYPEHVEKAQTIFGYHLLKGDTAYLYEAPMDAVHVHGFGLEGAVSSYGVHVSDTQMGILCDSVKTLYLCLDNDAAGRAKERDIYERYRGQVRLMFVNYERTRKKDHGEMGPEDIEWSINHAISALRYRP